MERTIIGEFETRREAELAVERVVQEYGIARTDVFIQPKGSDNSAGARAAGADIKSDPAPSGRQQLDGALEVSVDYHGNDPEIIVRALQSAGAKSVQEN